MEFVLKGMLILFVLIGVPFVVYGARKVYGSLREEAVLPPPGKPAGKDEEGDEEKPPSARYVISKRFLLILLVGLAFVLIPILIWVVVVPSLESPAGVEMAARMENDFAEILDWKVGPFTVRSMFIGFGVFFGVVFLLSIVTSLLRR